MISRRFGSALALLALAACGGGSPAGPSTTPTPAPTPTATGTVFAVVFLDENGNGVLDVNEHGRVPGVEVVIGGRSAASETGTGRLTIPGVPSGPQSVSFRSMPPFYTPPVTATSVQVQANANVDANIPLVLPIGSKHPGVYLAFGDSITNGDGSSDDQGYRGRLQSGLQMNFGTARILDGGVPATKSNQGATRLPGVLAEARPAYALIVYGTNDWNSCNGALPCFTISSIRSMIRSCKDAQVMPVVSTIPPVNPTYVDKDAFQRNNWVTGQNEYLKAAVAEEGALLVDNHAAFMKEPNLAALFSDHIHPNDRGYEIMAETFLRAIVTPKASGSAEPAFDPFDGLFVNPATAAPRATERPAGRAPPRAHVSAVAHRSEDAKAFSASRSEDANAFSAAKALLGRTARIHSEPSAWGSQSRSEDANR